MTAGWPAVTLNGRILGRNYDARYKVCCNNEDFCRHGRGTQNPCKTTCRTQLCQVGLGKLRGSRSGTPLPVEYLVPRCVSVSQRHTVAHLPLLGLARSSAVQVKRSHLEIHQDHFRNSQILFPCKLKSIPTCTMARLEGADQ
jgi:hypothetical protein